MVVGNSCIKKFSRVGLGVGSNVTLIRLIHVTKYTQPVRTMCLHLSIKETFRQNFTAFGKEEPQSRPAMAYENTFSYFD